MKPPKRKKVSPGFPERLRHAWKRNGKGSDFIMGI